MSTAATTTSNDIANNNQTLIFVYGTLKQGFPNHYLIEDFIPSNDAVFLGKYQTLKPFPLVTGPLGIPFLINKSGLGFRGRGELYSVSGRALARLDQLEGISRGHYERLSVEVAAVVEEDGGGDGRVVVAEGYFCHRSYGEELCRKSGEVGMEEYMDREGEKYVRVEKRDVGKNFMDYVRLYLQGDESE